jgi:hypothetical protein
MSRVEVRAIFRNSSGSFPNHIIRADTDSLIRKLQCKLNRLSQIASISLSDSDRGHVKCVTLLTGLSGRRSLIEIRDKLTITRVQCKPSDMMGEHHHHHILRGSQKAPAEECF